jgi:two-component system cell cycle response regulator
MNSGFSASYESESAATPDRPAAAVSPDSIGQRKVRLLVIEDDADQRELLMETLHAHFGAGTVVGVAGRRAALELDLGTFDLILSDYNLVDCNGLDLLSTVRYLCSTPVVMVTGENVSHTAALAIKRGAMDYVVKTGDYLFTIPLVVEKNLAIANIKRENETLRGQLEQALLNLQDKNAQLEQSLKRVEEMAATDPLTGLYNRRHFVRALEQLFHESQRAGTDLSCVMVDMDGFKHLNDSRGHMIGDQVLVTAAHVITAGLRRMDLAARYGGDEFVLLLPHARSEEAVSVVERIRDDFRIASGLVLATDGIAMSCGIASMSDICPSCPDHLVSNADAALYRAKAAGRNRIVVSAPVATSLPLAIKAAG